MRARPGARPLRLVGSLEGRALVPGMLRLHKTADMREPARTPHPTRPYTPSQALGCGNGLHWCLLATHVGQLGANVPAKNTR